MSTSPALDGMQERLSAEVARRESAEAKILELEGRLKVVAERDAFLSKLPRRDASPPTHQIPASHCMSEQSPRIFSPPKRGRAVADDGIKHQNSMRAPLSDGLRSELETIKTERSLLLSRLASPVSGNTVATDVAQLAALFEQELALAERAGAQRAAIVWQSQLKEMSAGPLMQRCTDSPRSPGSRCAQLTNPSPRSSSRRERDDSMPAESPRSLRNSLSAARRERDELRHRVSQADLELAESTERLVAAQQRSTILQDELQAERRQRAHIDEQTQQQAKAFEERLLSGEQQMDQLASQLTQAYKALEQQLQDEATRRKFAEVQATPLEHKLVVAEKMQGSVQISSQHVAKVQASSLEQKLVVAENLQGSTQIPSHHIAKDLYQDLSDGVADQLQANLEARLEAVGKEDISGSAKKNSNSPKDVPKLVDLEQMCETALRSHPKPTKDAVVHRAESLINDLSHLERRLSAVELDGQEDARNDIDTSCSKDQAISLRRKLALAESIARQVVAGRPDEDQITSLQKALALETQRRMQAESHSLILRQQIVRMQKPRQASVTNLLRQTSDGDRHVINRTQSLNIPSASLCSTVLMDGSLPSRNDLRTPRLDLIKISKIDSRPLEIPCVTPRRERSADDFLSRSTQKRQYSVTRQDSANACKRDFQVLPAPTAVVHTTRYLPPTHAQRPILTPRSVRQTSPTRVLVPVVRSTSLPRFGTASGEVSPRSGSGCATPTRPSSPPSTLIATPPTPGHNTSKVFRSFSAATQPTGNVRVMVSNKSATTSPAMQFRAPIPVASPLASTRSTVPAPAKITLGISGGSNAGCKGIDVQ
eukprot:CAMPEP_0169083640 /NCGR_PEP_ID=MMETSP1015-20121227/12186_1 /TAXON_ID=342587 /ORGANISM="Karlodinium micrum, Strain CCMP2283" /LENGTH=825 /DNA_ID=CAMNT_0009143577 /DNA_START=180 /DNA_END=2654 /DNA_ORIENTATION=+